MIIDGEEIFKVEGPAGYDMLYVPLRSYVAQIPKGSDPLSDGKFLEEFVPLMKSRPYRDMVKCLDDMHRSLPELSIPITDDCNLRCVYCYARAGDEGKTQTFTREMIDAIIESYFEFVDRHRDEYLFNIQDSVCISIAGGGEPTTRPELFRHTILECEKRAAALGLRCRFGMPTNMTCGEDLMRFITDHFEFLSVSMDGPEAIQNSQRPYRNGRGSFDTVMRNVRIVEESGLRYSFRVTVTPDSVHRMREIVDFFNDNFPGRTISLEKMHQMGRALFSETEFTDELFNEKFRDVCEYGRSKGIPIRNAIMFGERKLRPVFCGAVGVPNWTVTIDGRIASCTRDNMPDEFTFGRFDFEKKRFVIDEDRIARIRKLNVFEYPECRDCFCKYTCAGDCPDLRFIEKPNCDLTRKINTDYLINKVE